MRETYAPDKSLKTPVCPTCGRPAVGTRMQYVGGTGYVESPACEGGELVCAAYEAIARGWVPADERVQALVAAISRRQAA